MRLGLRLFLGFFLIVGLAAFFVMRVFVDEVKPGVRQAMESTLVDTANVLAAMAADDLKAGGHRRRAFRRRPGPGPRPRPGGDDLAVPQAQHRLPGHGHRCARDRGVRFGRPRPGARQLALE